MKKVCLALLVLIVSVPAMAAVNITLTQGPEPNSAIVNYACTAGEEVRGFALEVTVSNSALVPARTIRLGGWDANYYVTPTNVGFTSGAVRPYNSPIVEADANGCIIEMASLYAANDPCVAHKFPPPSSGQLVQLVTDNTKAGCDGVITVTVTQANAKRGGVVLTNATSVVPGGLPATLNLMVGNAVLAWNGPSQAKGDATGDGACNLNDLLRLRAAWLTASATHPHGTANGQYNCAADFNRNGSVNLQDLLVLRQNWLATGMVACPPVCPP